MARYLMRDQPDRGAPLSAQTLAAPPEQNSEHLEASVEGHGFGGAGARSLSPVFSAPPPRPRRPLESPLVTGGHAALQTPTPLPLEPSLESSGPPPLPPPRAKSTSITDGRASGGAQRRGTSSSAARLRRSTQSTSSDEDEHDLDDEAICSSSVARESLLASRSNAARKSDPGLSAPPTRLQAEQQQTQPQPLTPSAPTAQPAEVAQLPAAEQPTPAATPFCSTPTRTPTPTTQAQAQPVAPASPEASGSPPLASLAPTVCTAGPGRLEVATSGPASDAKSASRSPSPPCSPTEVPLQVALSSALAHMDLSHISIEPPLLAAQQAHVYEAEDSITLLNADTSTSISPPYVAHASLITAMSNAKFASMCSYLFEHCFSQLECRCSSTALDLVRLGELRDRAEHAALGGLVHVRRVASGRLQSANRARRALTCTRAVRRHRALPVAGGLALPLARHHRLLDHRSIRRLRDRRGGLLEDRPPPPAALRDERRARGELLAALRRMPLSYVHFCSFFLSRAFLYGRTSFCLDILVQSRKFRITYLYLGTLLRTIINLRNCA